MLKTHFNPKPSSIVQKFRFNTRDHHAGESLATYVAELRVLVEYCKFGTTIKDMIRDRLLWYQWPMESNVVFLKNVTWITEVSMT